MWGGSRATTDARPLRPIHAPRLVSSAPPPVRPVRPGARCRRHPPPPPGGPCAAPGVSPHRTRTRTARKGIRIVGHTRGPSEPRCFVRTGSGAGVSCRQVSVRYDPSKFLPFTYFWRLQQYADGQESYNDCRTSATIFGTDVCSSMTALVCCVHMCWCGVLSSRIAHCCSCRTFSWKEVLPHTDKCAAALVST